MPLQIAGSERGLLKTGIGFTTTDNLNGLPRQPPVVAPGIIGWTV